MKRSVAFALAAGLSCTAVPAAPHAEVATARPSPTIVEATTFTSGPATPSATVSPPPLRVVLQGRQTTFTADRDLHRLSSDGRWVVAVHVAEPGTGPRSFVLAGDADAPSPTLRELFTSSAHITNIALVAGRLAYTEYTEDGRGGWSARTDLLDLATGARREVWKGSFTAATFRGGGGGPRRAGHTYTLDERRIAYTHLIERTAGDLSAELRVREIASGVERTIGRSDRWIDPIGFALDEIIYSAPAENIDQMHAVELATGRTRLLLSAPNLRSASLGGGRLLYSTTTNEQAGPYRLLLRELATGQERTLDENGDLASLGALAVWRSHPSVRERTTFKAADPRDGAEVRVVADDRFVPWMQAVRNGVLVYERAPGRILVHLVRTGP